MCLWRLRHVPVTLPFHSLPANPPVAPCACGGEKQPTYQVYCSEAWSFFPLSGGVVCVVQVLAWSEVARFGFVRY
jgi:hypothetical protein